MEAAKHDATHFSVELHSQGANAIVAVPENFRGSVTGKMKMSPTFTQRSSLIVQDEEDPNKTRYSVAPPAREDSQTETGDPVKHSAVSHTTDSKAQGPASAGKPYLCTLEEYALEFSDAVEKEGDLMVRYQHSFWPVRVAVYIKRLFTYGSTGERVAFIAALIGILIMLSPFLVILYAIRALRD